MNPDDVRQEQVILDWMKVAQHQAVSSAVLANLEASFTPNDFWGGMHARLSAYVLTEQLPPADYAVEVDMPTTWVDALKRKVRFTPIVGRWPRRFPPRPKRKTVTVTLKPFYAYPEASVPPEQFGRAVKMYRIDN